MAGARGPDDDEDRQRLLGSLDDLDDDDNDFGRDGGHAKSSPADGGPPSSSAPPPPGSAGSGSAPRNPLRVRFNLEPIVVESAPRPTASFEIASPYGSDDDARGFRFGGNDDDDDDDYGYDYDGDGDGGGWGPRRERRRQNRHPLLFTDREAPSVTLANSAWAGSTTSLDEAYYDEDGILDPHAQAERERARPRSGLRSAFVNMANSIIGAGIIGQPYALRQAGLAAGIVLLVALTVIVDWTIRLIVINSKLSGSGSFQGTVERCFGRPGLVAISLAQWLFAFGGMVAFCVIVGDSIPSVLRGVWPGVVDVPVLGWLADRKGAIVVLVLGVSYPLTLYRDISKLAHASTLALGSMVIILVTVVVQGVLAPAEDRGKLDPQLLVIHGGIFQAIGVISFAFVCHHNSLLIYGSLKTPTINRFALVTHVSTAVSMLACLAMALAGFLVFGDRTMGNVLNNFPADNAMVNLARLCFGLNMLTTLPLEAFVCREVMMNYYVPGRPFSLGMHVLLSTALVLAAVALSLVTCDLGIVFELVGATSAAAMAYVLPPLCYIRLTTRSWKTYAAAGVIVFGTTVMAISMVQSVQKMISGEMDSARCS